MLKIEQQKEKRFYNVTEDYIFATEQLYQYIIKNKMFKGGDKLKKELKIL